MPGDRTDRPSELPPSGGSPATVDVGRAPPVTVAVAPDAATATSSFGIDQYRLSLVLDSRNPVMLRATATAQRVACFEMPVLLTGETGTGKSILAAAIHGWSSRATAPFVTVSGRTAAGLRREPTALMGDAEAPAHEEELWPHPVRHGTLFLDEVGMLSSVAQAKLICFFDEDCAGHSESDLDATASTRVIAATSRDLEKDVQAGRFRRDLFFRLNAVTIHLLPLRERREDLPHLIAATLAHVCVRHHRRPADLTSDVRTRLAEYDWRGNLRELETVLEHAVVLARTNTIELADLPARVLAASR